MENLINQENSDSFNNVNCGTSSYIAGCTNCQSAYWSKYIKNAHRTLFCLWTSKLEQIDMYWKTYMAFNTEIPKEEMQNLLKILHQNISQWDIEIKRDNLYFSEKLASTVFGYSPTLHTKYWTFDKFLEYHPVFKRDFLKNELLHEKENFSKKNINSKIAMKNI